MSQRNPASRVSSGVPWWVWLTAILATAAVITGIVAGRNTDDPDDLFDQAIAAADGGDGKKMVSMLERLRGFPERQDLIDVLEGMEASATKRDPRAIRLLKPHLDHKDERLRKEAVKYSALAYQRTGQAAEARELYQRAADLDPSDVMPRMLLASLFKSAGAYVPALEQTRSVLAKDPENSNAAIMIGQIQMELGQWQEAADVFGAMLDTDGKRASASPEAINRYLMCLLQLRRPQDALEFLDANPALVNQPGIKLSVLIENGQTNRAREALTELMAMEAKGSPTEVLIDAREAIQQKQWVLAVGLLAQYINVVPRSKEAFELLQQTATNIGKPELAQAAEENIQAINELDQQISQAILEIGSDVEDVEKRLEVARLAMEVGRLQQAREWFMSAAQVASERQTEVLGQLGTIVPPSAPLVPIPADAFTGIVGEPAEDASDALESPASEETAADDNTESGSDDNAAPDDSSDAPQDDG